MLFTADIRAGRQNPDTNRDTLSCLIGNTWLLFFDNMIFRNFRLSEFRDNTTRLISVIQYFNEKAIQPYTPIFIGIGPEPTYLGSPK